MANEANITLQIQQLKKTVDETDAIVIGAGADDTFVEDAGWNAAAQRYSAFLEAHQTGKVLYLELGVGGNTPVIIKYPFWCYTYANPDASYACVTFGEAYAHTSIQDRSILIDADIDLVLDELVG